MSSPVSVILVEGKNITASAALPQAANGTPVRMKAAKGAKFLFTAGKDGAVNENIIVKRAGKNLQVFLDNNDDQPALVIEDYFGNQAELAGMGSDGQYHTFITEGADSQAFMMLEDGAATPLLMSSSATAGLSGLSLTSAAAGGMSMGWMIAGAIGGLLALGGVAAAAGGGGGGKGGDDNPPAPEPAPAPEPVDMNSFTLTDGVGSVGGPVSAGGTTDDARPVMAGSGTPGNTVRIYDNGQLIGSTVIDASGRWQWQPESNLAAGQHDLSFSEVNRDGVESERSEGFGFELDLTAPARVSELVIADGVGASQGAVAAGDTINDNTPTFSGKAEPGATVEIRDNGELIGSALVGADGSWSFTPSPALANGEHNFTVVVVDPAGNKGLPVGFGPVIIDDTLVDVPTFGELTDGNGNPLQPGGSYNTNPMHMGGNGNPGDIVTIIRNGQPAGSAVVDENGKWQFELVIPENEQGEQSVGLIVTSPSGEELGRSEDFSFEFDTTPPATPSMDDVSVTDGNGNPVGADDITNVRDLIFSGSAQEGELIKLYDGDKLIGSALVGADGSWTIPVIGIEEGSHDFRTEITDAAGNVSEKSDGFGLELDLTPPAQSVPDVTDASGNPVSGGSAVNGDLTFSGTGEPGAVVYLRDGADVIGSAVIDANGEWSLVAEMTEERDYAFSTEVVDAAGNSSGLTAPIEFTFDATPPEAPSMEDVSVTDGSGNPIAGGDLINVRDLVFSGSAQEGELIKLYDGDELVGSALVGADGRWSIPVSDLAGGSHNFRTEITDAAGNVSEKSDGFGLELDLTPPAQSVPDVTDASGNPVSGGSAVNGDLTFSGTGEPGAVVYLRDGADVIGSAVIDANGEWSLVAEMTEERDYAFSTEVVDAAGNSSGLTAPIEFTFDATPPEAPSMEDVSVTDGSGNPIAGGDLINVRDLVFSGSAQEGELIKLYDGDELVGSALVGADGRWSIPVSDLAGGSHNFRTEITDAAGNVSEKSEGFALELDLTPPAQSVPDVTDASGNPVTGGAMNSGELIFSGTGEPGAVVYLRDGADVIGSAVIDANGEWSLVAEMTEERDYAFSTEVVDAAGNSSGLTAPIEFTYDITPPDAPDVVTLTNGNDLDLSAGGLSKNGNLTLSGLGGTPGDIVILYDGNTPIGSALVKADGSWSVAGTLNNDGQHAVSASFTDAAGNESAKSTPAIIELDSIVRPPVITGIFDDVAGGIVGDIPLGEYTNDSSPTVSGTAEPGATVRLRLAINSADWGEDDGLTRRTYVVIADENGNWSITIPDVLQDGRWHFRAEQTDLAGNSSSLGVQHYVQLITTPPDAIHFGNVLDAAGNSLSNQDHTNTKQPTFNGTGKAGQIITLIDTATGVILGSAVVAQDGSWSIIPVNELEDANITFRLDVQDLAGNITQGSETFELIIDSTAPEVARDVILEDLTPTLSGAANSVEAGALVIIQINGQDAASVVANSDGSWRWVGDHNMADGSYAFTIVVADQANNRSEPSDTVNYEVVTTLWDLNDGQQGWQAAPGYAADTANTSWDQGYFHAGTTAGFNFLGEVIYQSVEVVAGQHYQFSFEGTATSNVDYARLGIEVDGVFISDKYTVLSTSSQLISAEFTAEHSGFIRIAIVNQNGASRGNDFNIDNLILRSSGPGSESSSEILSVSGDKFIFENYSLLLNDETDFIDLSQISSEADELHKVSLDNYGSTTLNISLADVLSLGQNDLFLNDGAKQMMITGDAGDVVNLSDMLPDGTDAGDWNIAGDVIVGGVTYQVYQHSGLDADLLVQQNVTVNLDNH